MSRRAGSIRTRPLAATDRAAWSTLWAGYLRFYRQRLPEEATAETFARLVDPARQPHGIVAEADEGGLDGFVHFLHHPTTWATADVVYLEDLYVDPGSRGGGVGRALIEAVYAQADAKGAAGVYWMTQEYNAEGRALYDTLARRTSFIRYER